APPITNTGAPAAVPAANASSSERATRAPAGAKSGSRLTTILVRPGRGRKRAGRESQVLRPMTTGCPQVSSLKRRRSAGRCRGRALPAPCTPWAATAAIRQISAAASDGDGCGDGRVGVIAVEPEILVAKPEQVAHLRVEVQLRQRSRRAAELQVGLFQMV